MPREMKPLSEACVRLGLNVQSIKKIIASDPTFPACQLGSDKSHWRYDPAELEAWIASQRRKRVDTFRGSIQGKGGIHSAPAKDAEADAADHFRFILLNGVEPEGFWRNAAFLFDAPPADICVGLGLASTASWGIAVEKAERLIALPAPKKVAALKDIAERLAAHASLDDGASLDDDEVL